MSNTDHERCHRDLGVYVLGALEPAERDELEQHLSSCSACREELATLAVLPALLSRVGDLAETTAPPPLEPVLARLSRERRRARWRTRLLGALAVAATSAAVLVGALALPAPAPPGRSFVAAGAPVTAEVSARDWGMAVRIDAESLPPRRGYVAVAVGLDDHRTQVASWSSTDGAVTIEGACYLRADEVARLEILAAEDDELLTVLQPG